MSSSASDRIGFAFAVRLALWYTAFFAVVLSSFSFAVYHIVKRTVHDKEKEVVHAQTLEYRAWFEDGGLPALKARFDEELAAQKDVFFVRVTGTRDHVLFMSVPLGHEQFDTAALNRIKPGGSVSWYTIPLEGPDSAWVIGSTTLGRGMMLQVGKSAGQSALFLSHFKKSVLWTMVPVLLLGFSGGCVMTYRAMHPVRSLIFTVRDILHTGDFRTRVADQPHRGELSALTQLFNRLLDKNEHLINAMHEALDNVAHDLRTPMTHLRNAAEFSLQSPDNHEAQREALADCMEESDRVLEMLRVLMDLAEATTGTMQLNIERIAVDQLVAEVIDVYSIVAEERRIQLDVEVQHACTVEVDRPRMRQVLANLLDNAMKYSPDGTTVTIRGAVEGELALISVRDEGMGISENELPRIWERLYRGDRSRSKSGLGLGLSFVWAIVQAHGGRVEVESALNKGSTFTVYLPFCPQLTMTS